MEEEKVKNIISEINTKEEKNEDISLEEIESFLEKIKNDFNQKNYQKAEENYKIIFEDKNIETIKDINKKINLIEILNNYALILYRQMKYESASKILYKIIVNYDNKNKEAYLLFLKILCDINEYNKAKLLMEKVNKIMNNEIEEFSDINKDIEANLKIKNNNIRRQYYYNAQKNIFKLTKQLRFFIWCFYSIGALIIGHFLSNLILKN